MTTININVTSVCIYIIVFFILFAIAYWYITLDEGSRHRKMYRVANILWSCLAATYIILMFECIRYIFSHIHFTFTF